MTFKMDKKRNKHSKEEIKLKIRDESEMNFEQAQAGNEVQKALAENRLFGEGRYEGLKNNPCIWLSAALKFKRVADLVRTEVEKDKKRNMKAECPIN